MKTGMRFALDRDESNRVVEAGTQKALKAGFAETFDDNDGSTLYRLTAEGKEMLVHLNTVFPDGGPTTRQGHYEGAAQFTPRGPFSRISLFCRRPGFFGLSVAFPCTPCRSWESA